eukprot:1483686-Rhodomonas_salina.3
MGDENSEEEGDRERPYQGPLCTEQRKETRDEGSRAHGQRGVWGEGLRVEGRASTAGQWAEKEREGGWIEGRRKRRRGGQKDEARARRGRGRKGGRKGGRGEIRERETGGKREKLREGGREGKREKLREGGRKRPEGGSSGQCRWRR